MPLSADQEEGIERIFAATSKSRVLTGPAGTGKSFMQKELQERALDRWLNVEFIASTGRAASRLRDFVDAPVLTAHAAVYGSVREERKLVKQKDGKEAAVRTGKLIFGREHAPCMPDTLLICDEGGMIDAEMHKVLVRNLPRKSTILYVGDREQLPPVEGTWGPDFDNPTAVLDTVHRQALESPIIRLATSIRRNEPFDWGSGFENMGYDKGSADKAARWLCERKDACVDATLLTWTNTVRRRTNSKVRALLGLGAHLAVGDKLVCLANNYSLGLMNGETVDVKRVEKLELHPLDALAVWTEDDFFLVAPDLIGLTTTQFRDFQLELEARYANPGIRQHDAEAISSLIEQDPHDWHPEPKELARMFLHVDYGFCLTVHKAQGSEWDEVGFMRCWALDKKADTEPEFVRRLDYTAITRARKGLQIWDV